jgi:hypothetical protein
MKHLAPILLLLLTSLSCTNDAPSPTPEFSIRDSLKTSVITVEVPNFDGSVDPITGLAYWYVWHSQDQESR